MKILLLVILVIVVTLVLLVQKSNFVESELPKIIWILWLQGWDNAPYLAQKARESWEKHNSGWEIKLVSLEDFSNGEIPYLNLIPTNQAKSDAIRLYLLSTYGGVWADSSLICMRPLDDWLPEMIAPSSLWMYHGRGQNCENMGCSWFMSSKTNSYSMKQWKKSCDEYWSDGKTEPHTYLWMDDLWEKMYESDEKVRDEWSKVPKICCEGSGQAHMLAGRVNEKGHDFQEPMPHVVKLSHGFDENDQTTNGNIIIKKSLGEM